MSIKDRIRVFVKLGDFLGQFTPQGIVKNDAIQYNDLFFDAFHMQIKRAFESNGWFTEENILFAFYNWSNILNYNNLTEWTSLYKLNSDATKKVAIITAGNIPLVGFHDFLSVLISGNKVLVKQSSNDKYFLPLIAKYLEKVAPDFKNKIEFTDTSLRTYDAVIATGSNNTARYFEYYFGKHPNIIRHNRNSIAVLTGEETEKDLKNLGEDIFRYFGLGCRSVAKIFVPFNYDFDELFGAIYPFKDIIEYKKYENNYDYNKAIYLMSEFKIIENGFIMFKEDPSYASPIASLFYEYYEDLDKLKLRLDRDKESIQCIVGNCGLENTIAFGQTQKPQLLDYADGIDTLDFLQKL